MADNLTLIKETIKSSEKPGGYTNYMSPMKKKRKRRMYADEDTEAGAVDDDATERIKKRNKMLEEAAG